jgi:excisionase family DNA binding protein
MAQLLTTMQVAELLQVSERTVRELAKPRTRSGVLRSNLLPCMRLSPRVLRFDRQAVEEWAAGHSGLLRLTKP